MIKILLYQREVSFSIEFLSPSIQIWETISVEVIAGVVRRSSQEVPELSLGRTAPPLRGHFDICSIPAVK